MGYVVPNFERGEVFLTNPNDDAIHRVQWNDGATDRRRALPSGSYRFKGYRVVKKDKKGTSWFISTTSRKGTREFSVAPGKTSSLNIKPDISLTVHTRKQDKRLLFRAVIQGEKHMGLTIYRDGKRIPIAYRILNDAGKVVATGNMKYG